MLMDQWFSCLGRMKDLALSIKPELESWGYTYKECLEPGVPIARIAYDLGKALRVTEILDVQRLTPKPQVDAARNVYSGHFGLQEFPLHTDLAHWYIPPRFLILRCVVPAAYVFTCLLDGFSLLNTIPRDSVLRAQFLPRRRLSGQTHLLRFLQKQNNEYLIRWDGLFIVPANREAKEVSDSLSRYAGGDQVTKVCLRNPGDTLVIDNWRMLHGRSAVPQNCSARVIERVYLQDLK
jgi:L-asparagine oxygenase